MRNQTRQLIQHHMPSALWITGALGLVLFSWVLSRLSSRFGYDWAVIDMPIPTLAALLLSASFIFFTAAYVARRKTKANPAPTSPALTPRALLALVFIAGLAARLVLVASEPALEDDYQRYLWDGAVAAQGINPYLHAPKDVIKGGSDHPLAQLAQQSGPVLERINHKSLTTIYPPVAQLAFAIAHVAKPFSLISWRSLLLISDIVTMALILALLGLLQRSPLWAALYWWNPVVLKEFFNSAHMDALILPWVLGALYLALRLRPVKATAALGVAIGIKIWPALLLPLVWRHSIQSTRQFLWCSVVILALCALWAAPYLSVGFADNAGTVAYAQRWTINSPLFTTLRSGLRWLFATFGDASSATETGSIAARVLVAGMSGTIALYLAAKPRGDAIQFLQRALITIAALILLAPAIYPWYTLWMAPLLAIVPELGLLLLYATIPLYYTYFYFAARSATALYQNGIVWLVWIPVWTWCFVSAMRSTSAEPMTSYRPPAEQLT